MKKSLLPCILSLLLFTAGMAEAGQNWYLTIDNRTAGDITLTPGDLRCWRTDDLAGTAIQPPGENTYVLEKKIVGCAVKDSPFTLTITGAGARGNVRMGFNGVPFIECPGLECALRTYSGGGWSAGGLEVFVRVR